MTIQIVNFIFCSFFNRITNTNPSVAKVLFTHFSPQIYRLYLKRAYTQKPKLYVDKLDEYIRIGISGVYLRSVSEWKLLQRSGKIQIHQRSCIRRNFQKRSTPRTRGSDLF